MSNENLIVNAIDFDIENNSGELRFALTKDQKLIKIFEFNERTSSLKGNIYSAKISSEVSSLEAYFIDYGTDKHGFLPFKEMKKDDQGEPIKYAVGDNILVQITKEERGSKGAAMTAEITIPGTFLVLMPYSANVRGISKNIDEKSRSSIEEILKELDIPKEMGVIARTSAKNRSKEELTADLKYLICLWDELNNKYEADKKLNKTQLLFQENQGIYKIIKDTIRPEINNIVIDSEKTADIIKQFVGNIYPELEERIIIHKSNVPIFTHYQIEDAIEAMYSRDVELQSGGRIVIDKTEAMYTIDVNSAQATGAKNVEKTALQTNLEAVRKTAQIINLREINGIIAIDLIDMNEEEHKQQVIDELNKAVLNDKSRVSVINHISELGVLQLSRQRSKPSLAETHLQDCPKCKGRGLIRSPVSFSYSLIHIIEQNAIHGKSSILIVQAPVNVVTYLYNEKFSTIKAIEKRQAITIKIIPNSSYEIPKYSIKRIRSEDLNHNSLDIEHPEIDASKDLLVSENKTKNHQVLTSRFMAETKTKSNVGIIQKILELFSTNTKTEKAKNNKNLKRHGRGTRKPAQPKKTNQHRRKAPGNNRRGPNPRKKNNPQTNS